MINHAINDFDSMPESVHVKDDIARLEDFEGYEGLSDINQTDSTDSNAESEGEEFDETEDEVENDEIDDVEAKNNFEKTLKKCFDNYMAKN